MPRATGKAGNKTTIAILAKAPIPGLVKTRLIPTLGAAGAADLQARLIRRTVEIAVAAALGPVVLWAAPSTGHPLFSDVSTNFEVALKRQPRGDLGARMLAATVAAHGPVLVIGTDCPVLDPSHLRPASQALKAYDAVLIPAKDGGYVLIGMRAPQPILFSDMEWSTATVAEETRRRMHAHGLRWLELEPLWDIDTADDLARVRSERLLG